MSESENKSQNFIPPPPPHLMMTPDLNYPSNLGVGKLFFIAVPLMTLLHVLK